MRGKPSAAIRVPLLAVSTSLVCAVTIVFSIYVPQTRGFFNIGETMVYVTALLFGALIGSFAGGVGSFLADILLGFPHYAFATLIIKASEGGIVGFLGQVKPTFRSKALWKGLTLCIGLFVGVLLAFIGSIYYSGFVELRLGIPPPTDPNVTFSVQPELWYAAGAVAALLILLMGFAFEPDLGWPVFSMLVGGAIMVSGYYVYQKFLLFPLFGIGDVVAEAEIPVNIGQMIVGLVIALPTVKIITRSLPQLKELSRSKRRI
jgi:uncharacterized membrane protein